MNLMAVGKVGEAWGRFLIKCVMGRAAIYMIYMLLECDYNGHAFGRYLPIQ